MTITYTQLHSLHTQGNKCSLYNYDDLYTRFLAVNEVASKLSDHFWFITHSTVK